MMQIETLRSQFMFIAVHNVTAIRGDSKHEDISPGLLRVPWTGISPNMVKDNWQKTKRLWLEYFEKKEEINIQQSEM